MTVICKFCYTVFGSEIMSRDFIKGMFLGGIFLVLLVGGVYFGFTYGINVQKKKMEKPIVDDYQEGEGAIRTSYVNSAYGVADAAKLYYTESLLDEVPVTTGSVTELKVSGRKPISGTWKVIEGGPVILEKVIFEDEDNKYNYICETVSNTAEIACQRQEK